MRILITTGGAPHSDVAVRVGALLAQISGGSLTLLTVVKNAADRENGENILARARRLTLKPDSVAGQIRVGNTVDEIISETREGRYDLVIVGTSSNQALITRFLGSVAERVIERAPCPVLVAKKDISALRRVLFCEGGRSPSLMQRFLNRLGSWLPSESDITVLHVMSQMVAAPGVPGWELRASAEELMEEHTPEGELLEHDLEALEQVEKHPHAKVRHGLVVDEIVDEARSGNYDLVVIGAHVQESGWERFLLDNLAQQILMHVDRSLVVV